MVTAWLVIGRGLEPPPPPPQPASCADAISTTAPSRTFMDSPLLPCADPETRRSIVRIRRRFTLLISRFFSDRHGPRERTRGARASDPERLQQRLEVLALG